MKEKNKIEGVENKEILIFALIIGGLLVLLMFEFFFFKGRTEVVEQIEKSGQQFQEMAEDTTPEEKKSVYSVVNDIVEMMNNKEYESLYAMLKDDYKQYYFREYSEFEDFIKVYAGENYYPKYSSYYKSGDLYYVIIDFLKEKYTREDLLGVKVSKVDTFVLEETKDGEFKFAMNGFVDNIQHNKSVTKDNVTFTLLNSVRNTETMKSTVIVSNQSEKDISVSTNNIYPNLSSSSSMGKLSPTNSVTLKPGEIGSLAIEYYFQYNSGKTFNGVMITGVEFDDGTKIKDFYINK